MTKSPDIKISEAAKELADKILSEKFVHVQGIKHQDRVVKIDVGYSVEDASVIIQTALTSAHEEGRRLALEPFLKWYPDYAELVNASREDGKIEGWWTDWDEGVWKRGMEIAQSANTPPSSPWQDIATAPKDGTRFIAFSTERGIRVDRASDFSSSGLFYDQRPGENYTHWMPLPSAPNKPAGGDEDAKT